MAEDLSGPNWGHSGPVSIVNPALLEGGALVMMCISYSPSALILCVSYNALL
jgi:hypothetical protein